MILTIAIVIGGLYVLLAALLYIGQSRLLFIPTHDIYRTPSSNGWRYDDVRLDVDGETSHGWFVDGPKPTRGVVLFSHGNAGNIADRLESIAILRRLGFDVLAYDYGGYGQSTGRPGEERCYRDIRAMWRYLTEERRIPPERIVLFGRSLGAAVSCDLAVEVDAGAVIIESTFLSIPAMAKRLYPIYPARLLSRLKFDNAEKITRVDEPLLVVHSPDDTIIPFEHGKKLYELASDPKQFLEIRGDHNEGFWQSGAAYTEGLDAFLREALGESPPAAPASSSLPE